jgi:hypothetical protein
MSRARLTCQRDRHLARAADFRESAYRCADREPDRAEMLMHDAREALRDARAITDALDMLDAMQDLTINDERQLALGGML